MSEAALNAKDGDARQFVDETGRAWSVGRHKRKLSQCSNVVTIDEDLRDIFPTEKAVNEALRAIASSWPPEIRQTDPQEKGFLKEERELSGDYEKPFRTVVIHNDVHRDFPNADAVNRALHSALRLFDLMEVYRIS